MIKANKKKDISFCSVVCRIVPMAFRACPIYFIICNLVGILHGLSHGFSTYMTQKFFDSVSDVIGNNGMINDAMLMAVALGIAFILSQILNGIDNFMYYNKENIMIRYISKKINNKAGKLDPLVFEKTECLDDIKKAKIGAQNSANLLEVLTSIFTLYLPYFVFMAVYLYKLKPILVMSILIIFIPTVITQLVRVKLFDELADEAAPIRREFEYYERCIGDREYYKETRILGAFIYFKNLYLTTLKLLNKKIWTIERKSGFMELGMKLITLLGYMGVLCLLFDSLLKGDITVGAFGAVFSSIGFMISVMEEIICRRIGDITRNLGTVKNLIRFLDMPEREGEDVAIKGVPNISVKNVSFIYPDANKASLYNINLEIKSGETIAIVGANGAGKSTLVKLLMGIYRPTDGRVLLGGADTTKASSKSIYENISAVFQKYQRYKMTLGDNTAISSVKKGLNENSKIKHKYLEEALTKADLQIEKDKFPYGYETVLSREFDGVDLSGGQWQRVAIARAFYRKHNMIVLDEPTAAIDPVQETKMYNKFAQMSEGKTAIIVTHRLGPAKIADRIVVMDDGGIAEIGTHDELIKKRGKYREMYEAQSKWYVNEEEKITM